MKKKGIIFVISAPSGTGKSTICKSLFKRVSNLKFSVSCTTRKPRPGEKNGREYYFISEPEFKRRIKHKEFAEWARVHGGYYGTPKSYLEKSIRSGKDILLDIDVVGAMSIKKHFPEAVMIFIKPPTFTELKRRIMSRGTETPRSLRIRLSNAKKEMKYEKKYEHIIVNDKVAEAVKELEAVVNCHRSAVIAL